MIKAILDGMDVHCFGASLMESVPYEDVLAAKKKEKGHTERELELLSIRQAAKAFGFGIMYGQGPGELSVKLKISFREAKALRERYLDSFPMVRRFIDDTHRFCRQQEHVRTILGRYRRLPAINYEDSGMAAQAERQAVNSIIQGSAADIAKKVMNACEFHPDLRDMHCNMLLQIHDELVFEIPRENAEVAIPIIKDLMEHPFDKPLAVPLPVDLHAVDTWGEGK
jgi:DNA polymerase-1